ncbi:hypothetical protein [Thalassotalea sp. G2M2-11]|uniref:hypothetical protein n=1 Tax=Thalassotalea sp. G2M2-11 TaxID=2787627 RepID=UPI0019CF6BFB|nr:hypothetical protein [Thalassotalea sp. G2M2-11]
MTVSLPITIWKALQISFWLIGVLLVLLLLFKPDLGILLFWNLLIPIAPALLVLLPGVWRNICPLSSTALFPRKLKFSKAWQLTTNQQAWLYLLGVIALLLIVPLRHLLLNTSGLATAVMLLVAVSLAVTMGMLVKWRSGWCATACPIHSVERMYGSTPLFTTDNAHCHQCEQCISLCPDSTKQMTSSLTRSHKLERLAATLMTGGFFGFIWGWNHVPDYRNDINLSTVISAYAWPLLSGMITLLVYLVLTSSANKKQTQFINRLFATLAISCYYWYRIPSLFGVGLFPNDGVLIDLSASLPSWFPLVIKFASAYFFFWFMLIRPNRLKKQSWSIRPNYAIDVKNINA